MIVAEPVYLACPVAADQLGVSWSGENMAAAVAVALCRAVAVAALESH